MNSLFSPRWGMIILMIVLLITTLACNTPGAVPTPTATSAPSLTPTQALPSATPTITPTVAPTVTLVPEQPTATSEPTSTFVPPAVTTANVTYEGIGFYRDNELAASWSVEIVPADIPNTDVPEAWRVPSHYHFTLDGYSPANTFHKPRIDVFPVRNFTDYNSSGLEVVTKLQAFLKEQPATISGNIPFFPIFNAAQAMQAQVAYLSFQNGIGVRFLTQYGQAANPINNHEMFYTYQGITLDGQYYVSVIMPVAHSSLPADGSEIPGGDANAFANNYDNYIDDIELQLSNAVASSFTPNLEMLDVMVQSMTVQPK